MSHDDWDDHPSATAETGPPRFCPRCVREAGAAERDLCAECGEALLARGYCPVCEGYLCRAPGAYCPKHEIPLDDGPPGKPLTLPDGVDPGSRWVVLETFADDTAAQARRLRLESEGIPTFVEGERMGSRSMYPVATGGVKLLVPEPLLADARVLLAQTWAPAVPDDLDDAWEELAPDPGARRRRVMRVLILVVLLGPAALALVSAGLQAGARFVAAMGQRG